MTVEIIMQRLEALGTEQTRKTWRNHGATEPMFGVKVGDLKPIQKEIKKNYELSMALWETKNADARYLAHLIADEKQMTKADFNHWATSSNWSMLSEYAVASVAAESSHGWELAQTWIDSESENISSAGWSTLSYWISLEHKVFKINDLEALLLRIGQQIHQAQNRETYAMNGFIINLGLYVPELTEKAIATANAIGTITVNVGNTACKVPFATEYITKVQASGRAMKKKKVARC
jgi:3-methyladenine DNA glycosylase AlkD